MREIKFRAWETDAKEMSYDFLSKNWLRIATESPYAKLMQYTGLKDRNGKEVYEGDILQDETGVGEVLWVPEHCAFMIITREPSIFWRMEYDGEMKRSEVIGNIYENPELLQA